MNFYANAAVEKQQFVRMRSAFNITLESYNDGETPAQDNKFQFALRDDEKFGVNETYMRYTTIKNAPCGLSITSIDTQDEAMHIKNCLFFNNRDTSINLNGKNSIAYVEDCVFFNCSAFAIASVNYAQVYLKGFIDVYNFHSSDILNNIFGIKLPQ